jgi:hypothetical protein
MWLRAVLTHLFNHSDGRQDVPRVDLRAPRAMERLASVFAFVASKARDIGRQAKRQELIDAFHGSAGRRSHTGSGSSTRAPKGAPESVADTVDDGARGTLSRPFNDPRKTPERSNVAPASENQDGLAGAFDGVASRTRGDEKHQMKETLLAAFQRSGEPAARPTGDPGRHLQR